MLEADPWWEDEADYYCGSDNSVKTLGKKDLSCPPLMAVQDWNVHVIDRMEGSVKTHYKRSVREVLNVFIHKCEVGHFSSGQG